MRRAAKVDTNQSKIVEGLRRVFGEDCVFDASRVGRGFPDLIIGVRGKTLLMEVKTAKGKLTPDQEYFHRYWDGHVSIIRSLEDALAVIEEVTT